MYFVECNLQNENEIHYMYTIIMKYVHACIHGVHLYKYKHKINYYMSLELYAKSENTL